jgi:CheY-like chemotaxis protein
MTTQKELRAGIDRRRQSRGGRRPADVDGFSPLVMVVGDDAAVGDAAGAVLAKLRFAVTPSPTVEDALRVLRTMQPDLIVANSEAAGRIRLECPEHRAVIVVSSEMRDNPQLLVDEIRSAIRASAG